MKTYKAQLKHKASLLNRLNAAGIHLSSTQITDYPDEGIFRVNPTDDNQSSSIMSALDEGRKKNPFTKNIVKNYITRSIRHAKHS